jgi:hypothetical protein
MRSDATRYSFPRHPSPLADPGAELGDDLAKIGDGGPRLLAVNGLHAPSTRGAMRASIFWPLWVDVLLEPSAAG